MSRRYLIEVVIFIVLAATAFLCGASPSSVSQAGQSPMPQRVLFIGNSYTVQIRKALMNMLEHSPYKQTTFEFITKGGATLKQHVNNKSTLDQIKGGNWDFVVLQEQSQPPALPGEYEKSFHASVNKLSQLIRSVDAEPVLYMTWGRRDGDARNKRVFPDYDTMQQKLSDAYQDAAKRNRIILASVGEAWSIVRRKDKKLGLELYKKDGSHPSQKGALLASCVIFRTLFNDSLESIKLTDSLTQDEWKTIRDATLNN